MSEKEKEVLEEEKTEETKETKETKKTEETKETKETKKTKKDKKQQEIDELKLAVAKYQEEFLKSKADLENYKKRINEERIKDRKYAATNLINDLLIPLDQLKKVVNVEVDDDKLKNYLIGFKMISNQIYQVLEDDGLKEIKALNEKFDPNYHYAVEKENNKELENGIITEVINVGYTYKERVLRPAMVKVNEWSEENNEQEN